MLDPPESMLSILENVQSLFVSLILFTIGLVPLFLLVRFSRYLQKLRPNRTKLQSLFFFSGLSILFVPLIFFLSSIVAQAIFNLGINTEWLSPIIFRILLTILVTSMILFLGSGAMLFLARIRNRTV